MAILIQPALVIRTWPVFAYHDLHKRIYKLIKAARPNSAIVTLGHADGSQCMPGENFWDACVEGEYIHTTIVAAPYNGDYTAFYSPQRFSTEFSGRMFNTIPELMAYTELDSTGNGNTAQTNTIYAMALMNGSNVWPANVDYNVTSSVDNALDNFGVSNITQFLPYWDNHHAVTVYSQGSVYASVYMKSSSSLIAVSNLSANTQNVELAINYAELGLALSGMTVTDAVTGAKIGLMGSAVIVSVASKNFRLLVVSGIPVRTLLLRKALYQSTPEPLTLPRQVQPLHFPPRIAAAASIKCVSAMTTRRGVRG